MNLSATRHLVSKDNNYDHITRQIRWLTIIITAVTLPPNLPQSPAIYGLVGLAALYNLGHYMPALVRWRWFTSPITLLVLDNLFVGVFLLLIATVATPYSGFLIYMVISAAYRYGWRGLLGVIVAQAVFVAVAAQSSLPPYRPDEVHAVVVSLAVLLLTGFFVERLTRADRDERRTLKLLGRENMAERERLLTLINSLHDAIFVTDAKGRILLSNGAAQELTPTWHDPRGAELTKLLPLTQRSKPRSGPVNIINGSTTPQHRRDLRLSREDGTSIDLDINVTPVQIGNKPDNDYIVVCRDITKERSLDRQREEFISVASHELRTPLTIVEAAISTALLDKTALTPQVLTLLEQAHRNVVFLGGLMKDLTTLAQAQNDNIPVALKPVDPAVMLRQLAIDYKAQAKQKGLAIRVVVEPQTPSVLSTEYHIREVLQNYVNNALKYTNKGHVTLSAKPSQNGGVLFSVSDTGIGISVVDQKNLFTKFYRAEDYRTRETGGTGLGLYLCLELAERLNGRVWCESTLNEGSAFYLEVPPFSRLERDHRKVTEAQVSNLIEQL